MVLEEKIFDGINCSVMRRRSLHSTTSVTYPCFHVVSVLMLLARAPKAHEYNTRNPKETTKIQFQLPGGQIHRNSVKYRSSQCASTKGLDIMILLIGPFLKPVTLNNEAANEPFRCILVEELHRNSNHTGSARFYTKQITLQ